MLHNSGLFGPNDVPINMGAPVNMTPIPNAMTIGNNINSLAKMPQQTPQTTVSPFGMPDYSSFGHPPLNIGHSMSPFSNYHSLNFQQSYGHPSATLAHQASLNNAHNGMLPMNLNIQSDQGPTLANYNIETKTTEINSPQYKESFNRQMPINIPQIHTKAFHKHVGMDYPQHNSLQDNPFYKHDLSKVPEKSHIDSNRRKSLENTVKLIENILINNSSKDKLKTVQTEATTDAKVNENNTTNNTELKTSENTNTIMNLSANEDPLKTDKAPIPNENTAMKNIDTDAKVQKKIHYEPLKRSLLQSRLERPLNEPKIDTGNVEVKQEIEMVAVKIEPVTTWTDVDNLQPFLKDSNATDKDLLEDDAVIIDGDNLGDAISAIINGGTESNTYYECCHCNLLFKHPKRFLIHTKWHSFGLTNEKRQEVLREKEMRKNMKKEAKIIERLNSKEVKEKEAEGDVHPCKDCDKVFKVKSSLKNHRQRYHPTRVRECKICHATVVGWMALREHLNTHTGGGGYQCSECPKRFKYSHSLAKHKDTHLEKTHGCEQCEKKFGSQALLKMHMKCHERTARGATFRCTYCGKGFFESYNLQVHERTHRNERPFLCDICNTSFGTNSSLKRHLKVSHSASKPFPCPTCHRCFVSSATRARHTARVHADAASCPHACSLCPRRYRSCKELQRHVHKAHPKKKREKKE